MGLLRRGAVSIALALAAFQKSTAQEPASPLNRIVGLDQHGAPLVLTGLTGVTIGALAGAAHVPMGLEATAPPDGSDWRVPATGRSVREVLDAITTADPRYEWRDREGVIVIRPVEAWGAFDDPLQRTVGAIRGTISIREVPRIVAQLFGSDANDDIIPSHRRNVTVDLPDGTRLDALDGIVRAHGAMAWSYEPTTPHPLGPNTVWYPYTIWVVSLPDEIALGIGVSAYDAALDSVESVHGRPQVALPTGPPLDRIVGAKLNGQPVVLHTLEDVALLADLTHVPIGLELPSLSPSAAPHALSYGVVVTGLTLRASLMAIAAADPRYDWRELDGVVVLRPITTWNDPTDPLMHPIGELRLERVTISEAVRALLALIEPTLSRPATSVSFVDTKRFSVHAHGTMFDVLNAIARTHGGVCWSVRELDDHDVTFFEGRRQMLSFRIIDGSRTSGFAIP